MTQTHTHSFLCMYMCVGKKLRKQRHRVKKQKEKEYVKEVNRIGECNSTLRAVFLDERKGSIFSFLTVPLLQDAVPYLHKHTHALSRTIFITLFANNGRILERY